VGIEWSSVITSGTVSAVVSGIVSVMTARRVAGHQEAGRLATQARHRMRELVGPELTKVRQYQSRSPASFGRGDEEDASHQSDILLCAQLLVASADLTWWRRTLVRRRLRKLFGANTVELCEVHGQDAVSGSTGWCCSGKLWGWSIPSTDSGNQIGANSTGLCGGRPTRVKSPSS
jgi:hypothetical protein